MDLKLPPAWTPLRYHAAQHALWTSKARFVVVPAGRGSGKTVLAHRKLVMALIEPKPWPDPKYILCGPTEGQINRIGWQKITKLIPDWWIRKTYNGAMKIETIFGSTLQCFGLDAPQRIEGEQYDGVVIDENSDIRPKTFDLSIRPALTHRNGWCWFIGVPKRFGIGAAEYKQRWLDSQSPDCPPDTLGLTWPSKDIIPPSEIAALRDRMDQRDFDEQLGGTFVDAGGGIFYAFDAKENVRRCSYRPDQKIIVGSDFNVDPMAWVVCHRVGEWLEVFDELWLRDANTPMALDVLHARYSNHQGGFEFYGDASGRARKTSAAASDYALVWNDERFRKLGRDVFYPNANPTVADRFAACNALIRSASGVRRLFVDPHCKRLISDLETRTYKAGTREADNSLHDSGHISDALGYVVHSIWPITLDLGNLSAGVSTTGSSSRRVA